MPRCVVIDPSFDWEGDRPLETPWHETVIYELHVKGFTQLHPGVREDLRGTYAGLASDAAIEYLTSLGVTAVELLPVHQIIDERFIDERGLTNYWGYSSIGYLAPHHAYAATGVQGEQIKEFKGMVKALHRAGIEVILDVVYNHTAEGNHLGPMLAFKGIDNAVLLPPDAGRPEPLHGLHGDGQQPQPGASERAAADHGLAALLGHRVPRRRLPLRSRLGARARALRRRPPLGVLRRDPPGPGALAGQADRRAVGSRPGRLPGRQLPGALDGVERPLPRHDARRLARARRAWPRSPRASRARATSTRPMAATRRPRSTSSRPTTASRSPTSSPTTSKHNEANLEGNRDGTDDNRSWNCGVEGPTDDPEISALRERQQRNFLATLLLSQGVPMLLAGDEIGRTQDGNNNAWCQDNEISWVDWELDEPAQQLREFTRRLLELRRKHPIFHRTQFLERRGSPSGLPDAWWFRPDGPRMTAADWQNPGAHALGVFLNGRGIGERRARRASRSSTPRSCCCSTPTTRTSRSRCRRGASARAGRSSSRPRTRARPRRCSRPAARPTSELARCCCCASRKRLRRADHRAVMYRRA